MEKLSREQSSWLMRKQCDKLVFVKPTAGAACSAEPRLWRMSPLRAPKNHQEHSWICGIKFTKSESDEDAKAHESNLQEPREALLLTL